MAKKKKSLEEMSQIHAMEEKFVPTTLDQIWGDEGLFKYGTMNEDDYIQKLDEMNKTDLWSHASKIGLVPIDNIPHLKRTLISEFKKHVSSYRKTAGPQEAQAKIDKEVLKILAEGK